MITTTAVELIANLKHYHPGTGVAIEDVNDVGFQITDFVFENNVLTIVIGEESDSGEEDGE